MRKFFFFTLSIMLLAATGLKAQNATTAPVHFFYMVPQHNLHDSAFIADSLYANGNHDSMISIDYKIYHNGVLIDTVSKYGWAMLKLRQAGTEYVFGNFDSGTFDFPRTIPFAGMVAHSFSISVINAESGKQLFGHATPKCNRGRVPMLYMHFNVPGTYKVVIETYSQKGATVSYIGTMACAKYKDAYSLTGDKRALWTKDSLTFVVHPSFIHIDSAMVCQGDVYRWRGKVFTETGTYKDVVINQDGSDSVYQLNLSVIPTKNEEKTVIICSDGSCYWRGKYYNKPGVYLDSVVNKNGCKDRYKLTLVVRSRFLQVDTMWRCANTSFQWRGRTISSAGVHTWSYTPVVHCDSVYQLRVFNYPVYTKRDTAVICAGSSYAWQGGSYTVSGTYTKKYQTVAGCDSTHILYLTVDSGFLNSQSARVCSSNGYIWRGRRLYASGTYADSLKNRHGCDSVYRLVLELHNTYYFEKKDTVCYGQPYTWKGHSVSIVQPSAGNHTYWDSLKTKAGCDSVFKLLLTVRPKYQFVNSATVCANETYVWKGHSVAIGQRAPGSYVIWDSLKSRYGCDSVYKLNLTVRPYYYTEQRVSICDNELYVWPGHSVGIGKKAAGSYQYWDSLKTKAGCDSVFKLLLTVYPTYSYTEQAAVCAHETYTWKGHAVAIGQRAPGSYVIWDSLKTKHGCDSVYKLTLTVRPNHSFVENVEICDNETYVWKGHSVSVGKRPAGSYVFWDSLKTSAGCDSVYKLNLTVRATFLRTDTFAICDGRSHTWRGRVLTAPGTYSDSLKTKHGCDSVYRLVLIVRPSYLFEEIVPICNNDFHNWRGRKLNQPGVYTDSLKSMYGCDSIYRLDLRVNPVYLNEDTLDGCSGQSYDWRGKRITQSGVYMDSLKASQGCDSVFRLVVRLHPVYLRVDTAAICDHSVYRWHGRDLTLSGTYTDTLKSMWGCDSVCRLLLRVHPTWLKRDTIDVCDNDSIKWRGQWCRKQGLYYDSLKTMYGCDSVFTMFLRVHPTYLFVSGASICSHETYRWRGRSLTKAGDYFDSLKTIHGCDSIFKLHLDVRQSYFYYDTVDICDNGYYSWRGKMLTRQGGYVDSLVTEDGCPEVYRLWLRVHPTYLHEDTMGICDGGSYMWHGRKFRTAGVYYDSLKTVHGCDSIFVLRLSVWPVYLSAEKAEVCAPQRYVWRGRVLSESGLYTDSLTTWRGCDSVFSLQLTVHPSYLIEENRQICNGSTYEWRGRKLTVSGSYTDSLKTKNGCDSVFRIRLQVNPVYLFADTVVICGNDNFLWHGRRIRQSGVYTDSLKTMMGCDSIFVLSLTMLPTYHFADTVDLCGEETYDWRGRHLVQPGYYTDSLRTIAGCDSVYSLCVRVHSIQMTNDFAVICENEHYKWNGHILTVKGRYIDTLKSQYGCDSIVRFFLYTNPLYLFADTVDHCDTGVYTWRGRALRTNGCYTDSFKTEYGCDSVYLLELRIRPLFFKEEQKTICSNEPYLWHGRNLAVSGLYYDSLHSQYGCDSVYALRLTVNPAYLTEDTVWICTGASHMWRGKKYSSAGIYTDSLKTIRGCDSVFRLTLNLYPIYHFADTAAICQGGSYAWHGRRLQKEGVYYDSLKTVNGCDSIFRLALAVNPVYRFNDTVEICQGAVHVWRGKKFAATGIYTDSLKTIHGCDSIFRLSLKVNPVYLYSDTIGICQGERHVWRGRKLTDGGIYHDSLKTIHGCDSVFRLVLHVYPTYLKDEKQDLCSGERFQWRGRMLQAGGVYTDSLKTIHGCDSVFRLTLMVYPVYRFADTVGICQGERHNWRGHSYMASGLYTDSLKTVHGCDSVYLLQLQVNPVYFVADTIRICDNRQVVWHGQKLSVSGTYYDSLKTVSGCDSVFRLTLTVYPTFVMDDTLAVCADALPYTWHGYDLSVEGDYTDSLLTVHGCDSICRLRLIVNPVYSHSFADTICEGTPYNRYGFVLSADSTTGVPQLLLTDSLRSAEGCDSVVTLALQIRQLPKEMSQIHGDTLVPNSGTFMYYTDTVPGIDRYEWQVIPNNIVMTPSQTKVWLEFDKSVAGWDTLVLIGHHLCGQTSPQYLPIHVTIGLSVKESDVPEGVRLYPNPAYGEVHIELASFENWGKSRWMLCDMQGRVLDGGSVEGMLTTVSMAAYPRGVYVIRLLSEEGRSCSLKVIKY